MDDIEEYKALTSTLLAYYNFYEWEYEQLVKPRNIKYSSLPKDQRDLLSWYPLHTKEIEKCIEENKKFTQHVAVVISQQFGAEPDPSTWYEASHQDFDKVRSVLLQLMREWSNQGSEERNNFKLIIDSMNNQHPNILERQHIEVLVPGCGLGRLIYEFIINGYRTQGNELSYHMLIMSNFILNHCDRQFTIFPFLHKLSNVASRQNQIRPVTIPDTLDQLNQISNQYPDIPFNELMSIAAGSFTDLYGPSSLQSNLGSPNDFRDMNVAKFNYVVTCFFIDTASNIIEYLMTIKSCMKPNGAWTNFGPLLWHFENDMSVTHFIGEDGQSSHTVMTGLELAKQDLLELIEKIGFEFLHLSKTPIATLYSADPLLLSSFVYNCDFWTCTIK